MNRFFTRFHISSALKASNAYKKEGVPVMEIFQYLFLLIFSNRSMYMNLITGRNTPAFAKDTVYRFMKMIQINWIRFTTILSSRIIIFDRIHDSSALMFHIFRTFESHIFLPHYMAVTAGILL